MAEVPPLQDERLDLIVAIYAQAAVELAARLDMILDVAGAARFLIFQQIQRILADLEAQTDAWSRRFILEFVQEADRATTAALAQLETGVTLAAELPTGTIEALVRNMNGTMQKAVQSVEGFMSKVFRASALERTFPDLAREAQRELGVGLATAEAQEALRRRVARKLRTRFKDGSVTVVGANGRQFRFPLDYYAGMVAQNTRIAAETSATLLRAQEAQHDLVVVSNNPSKTGDWCDAYRGKVFSISGSHPVFPPLAAVPNGGPPFHPWCRHTLSIFIPEFYEQEELRDLGDVNQRFLLRPNETNPNRVAREWWAEARRTS